MVSLYSTPYLNQLNVKKCLFKKSGLPVRYRYILACGFRGETFEIHASANQKQELPVVPIL